MDPEQLERAIAAQEQLRGVVPDEIVDAALEALGRQLAEARATSGAKRRRDVTVLFADVVGFTALGEQLDAEELSDALDRVWARLDACITGHGGRIDKHIGDAVMALWGADGTSEDDAERALRAALALHREAATMTEVAHPIQLRIGINTGPVVLGGVGSTEEFTALGDTVNLASRLQAAAPPGGILIGHATYRNVHDRVAAQAQEPLRLKGKREPVRTYLVTGVRSRPYRPEARAADELRARLVGRDAEMAALREAFREVVRTGTAGGVSIVGDVGMGKSRLLHELEDWLRASPGPVHVLAAGARARQEQAPYALVRDLLFGWLHITEDDSVAVLAQKLRRGIGALTGRDGDALAERIEPLLVSVPAAPATEDARVVRDRATAAIGEVLSLASEAAPVALLLDDVHAADRASSAVLEQVRAMCAQHPVLVVAAERAADPLADPSGLLRIVLRPLAPADTATLVEELLGRAGSVPDAVRERLLDRAGGNPFYVEELVRMFIDDGVVHVGPGGWRIVPERLGDRVVPSTIRGVLQARLDRLPPPERQVLERAAVVGPVFWDRAVPGGGAPEAVLRSLEAKALVVHLDDAAFAGCVQYRFAHALLHEVTYDCVLRRTRREQHREVAAWLAAHGDARAHAALIARHLDAAGADADAVPWHVAAARHAASRYAVEEAIDALRRALGPAVLPAAERLPLLEDLHGALLHRAAYAEALAAAEAMRAAAQEARSVAWEALALVLGAEALVRQGRSRDALARAEEACALVRGVHDEPRIHMAVLTETAWTLVRLGRPGPAIELAEQALRLAPEDDLLRERRGAHSVLGAARHLLRQADVAADHLEQALALDRRQGDRRNEAASLINLGEIARLALDHERAATLYHEALAIVREVGDLDQEALTLSNLGGVEVGRGDHAEAITHLEGALARFARTGASEHVSETHRFLAEAHLGLGALAPARAHASHALEAAARDENPEHLGHAWRVLGAVAHRDGAPVLDPRGGPPVDALSCLSRAARVFHRASLSAEHRRTLAELAAAAEARGDAALAAAVRQQLGSDGAAGP